MFQNINLIFIVMSIKARLPKSSKSSEKTEKKIVKLVKELYWKYMAKKRVLIHLFSSFKHRGQFIGLVIRNRPCINNNNKN